MRDVLDRAPGGAATSPRRARAKCETGSSYWVRTKALENVWLLVLELAFFTVPFASIVLSLRKASSLVPRPFDFVDATTMERQLTHTTASESCVSDFWEH